MYYKYKVSYYSEYDDKDISDSGIVFAADYGAAANRIQKEYDNSINDIHLHEIFFDGEYCLNKEEIDYAFKNE